VALCGVVDEDGDVQSVDELGQSFAVNGRVLREVHGEGLGLHTGELGGDLSSEGIELGGGVRNEDDDEAFLSELESKFLADAVRRSGDHNLGAFGSILSELYIRDVLASSIAREVNQAMVPLMMNNARKALDNLRKATTRVAAPKMGEGVEGAITDEAVVVVPDRHDCYSPALPSGTRSV